MPSLPGSSAPARTALFLLALGLLPTVLAAQERVQVPPLFPSFAPATGRPAADTAGLRFRLSEAGSRAPAAEGGPARAQGTPLSPEETARLLDRLPPLRPVLGAADTFAFPSQSPPPPRTGTDVREPFPPRGDVRRPAPTPAALGPLEVTRRGPEGETGVASAVGVTVVFSHAMVPLTSVGEVAARAVPARITPQPRGWWRWIDVRTLRFEPAERLAGATLYRVEVPAGTRSALGGVLRQAVRWSFRTPEPRATGAYPNREGPAPRHPVIVIAWDQRMDAAAVLRTLRVHAGRDTVPIRVATAEEVAADPEASARVKGTEPGRWTAFRTTRPLPPGVPVRVEVGPGTPSGEGPLLTRRVYEWSFTPYGPLRVVGQECGWRGCGPGDQWTIRFSNPLDTASVRDSLVRVEPPLPGVRVQVWGDRLTIRGESRPLTEYRVRIGGALRDRFGQSLGADTVLTFQVGRAVARLWSAGEMVVLDPDGPPSISVYSNDLPRLRVRVHRVRPEDWPAFDGMNPGEKPASPPGREVVSRVVSIEAASGEVSETRIDLSPALDGGLGHAVVVVEVAEPRTDEERRQRVSTWVQSTRIGLTVLSDAEKLVAWAASLRDGAPLRGVRVELRPGGGSAATGRDGLATFGLPREDDDRLLIARQGRDAALLPESSESSGYADWQHRERSDALAWHVFTDRNLYRPGEEVRFKGWVRRLRTADEGFPALVSAAAPVRYTVRDERGNEVGRGTLQLSPLGGFDAAFTLPEGMHLGSAHVQLEADAGVTGVDARQFSHPFQVQEFRRPEYTVDAAVSDPGPHLVGGSARVAARARYYAGGGLAGAEVKWIVTAVPTTFTPPNWDRWSFAPPEYEGMYTPPVVKTLQGSTDLEGEHALRIDFEGVTPARPSGVRAEATVVDVNRQTWTTRTELLVHPAAVYAGLRTERAWVPRGTPLEVEVIVVDLAGKPVVGAPVEVRAFRTEWRPGGKRAELDPQVCPVTSAATPGRCTFRTEQGGSYRVVATVRDAAGSPSRTEMGAWVSGAAAVDEQERQEEGEVRLVADREEYRPGQTAEVLVQAPFHPARGVLTVLRSGITRTETFMVTEPTHVLRVPIEERDVPGVDLRVELVGAARQGEARGTAFAAGELELSVPPHTRALTVAPVPGDTVLKPGGKTTVEVEVRDAAGAPVRGAEVALVVVDEAVLALSGYRVPHPVGAFFPERYPDLNAVRSRPLVLLAPRTREDSLALRSGEAVQVEGLVAARTGGPPLPPPPPPPPPPPAMAAPDVVPLAGKAPGPADARPQIALRTDFAALAAFVPAARTDDQGRVSIPVELPSSLTRYRVVAVAVEEARFGMGESGITARQPLMVRASPPRFLNFGDRFELPVVVQNQSGAPLEVEVAARAAGLDLPAAGRRVSVPAGERVEVRFPGAADRAGVARFQVAVQGGEHADAAELSLPVWTPATAEAFAIYGTVDAGAVVLPVRIPSGVLPGVGGVEVTTASTTLHELTDALLYLVRYPYECTEQIASRVLAVAALRDVLTAFRAEGLPPAEEIAASVERDLKALDALQNEDGGWAFWRRGQPSWPYVSVHVAHALQRAAEKGYTVPPAMMNGARAYLASVDERIPLDYPPRARNAVRAYAVYVRGRMGDARAAEAAAALLDRTPADSLTLEARGWLLHALSGSPAHAARRAALLREVTGRAVETAATATFATSYGEGEYLVLHSERRTDAVVLEALIAADPRSDLIPRTVRGLLAHRRAGRWESTQENSWVLLALDRYFGAYERETPEFRAGVWLGERYTGGHAFTGRTTERHHVSVPMRVLAAGDTATTLTVAKEGLGRMYYRAGIRYAPASLTLAPAQHGFAVERKYEGVDDPADVRREADGTWRVKAGARVRVMVTFTAPGRRHHVALVDPLPAGFEPVNPELRGAEGGEPADGVGPFRHWRWSWWEHQNLRDDRAEAFTSLLHAGTYTYSYVARATTPGSFVVPPPRAEEMYHPETFGRGGTARVRVEDAR